MNKPNYSKKYSKGFTLTELLMTIAILVIIMAIAIPSLVAMKRNLEIQELDDTARQIYLVMQNKMTTMKATGSLENFNDTLKKDHFEHRLSEINLQPQDYDLGDEDWKKLYVLSSEDAVLQENIIGSDSILVSSLDKGSKFIVELNSETGDVYGVFYAKKAFSYDEVNYNGLPSRDRQDRKPVMIGYYGGSTGLSAASEYPSEFIPNVSVINKEDLYLKVTCTGMRKLIKTQRYIMATVTITDEDYVPGDDSNHIWTTDLKGGSDFWLRNDSLEFYHLIDSIRGGKESFKEITDGKLNLGDNLKVTISMAYSYDGITIVGSSTPVEVNSLFGTKDDNGNLTVSAVRHLNNLREEIYPYDKESDITISQITDIDFDASNWSADAVMSGKQLKNPLADGGFKPIISNNLLNKNTYNGNNNRLMHFKIRGTNYTGLFGKINEFTLLNTKLVDFEVNGTNYVGALVGEASNSTISACGVYLTTKDEHGRPLTDMENRVEKYKISASGSYAGGLVGNATGTTSLTDSFGAINVNAIAYAGGLVGNHSSGLITNCYSSGTITASASNIAYAGGLVGRIGTSGIENCYSTSDVIANGYSGGLVGSASGGRILNSKSYGLVEKSNHEVNLSTSGGFIGVGNPSINNCKYLKQASYNSDYTKLSNIATTYSDLKTKSANSKNNAYPYLDSLVNIAFPFVHIKDTSDNIINHYGNWPAELKLQSSLVYYEKYSTPDKDGGYYGYYAETSLTSSDADIETGGLNNWKVDTLRDEICIEDGYALMTIYSLTSYKYRLNSDRNASAQYVPVTISDTPGTNKSVRIANGVSITFTNISDNSTYEVTGAKVYQLPFELQMTDRNTAARFYDKVDVTGYIYDSAKFEDYTFFYCPDFAKNAINPDINDKDAKCPDDPTGSDKPIYVRSPRHINALGRAAYYWNTGNGSKQFHFIQETDINFATYVKTYCGKSYNLMDTSAANEYRNRPIGRPSSQEFTDPNGNKYTPSSFQNLYDGRGHEIIDYCCETSKADNYQFTGLFGEIKYATIKNIHLVASNPNNKSGYVTSNYNDNSHHGGVGALVGLVYVDQPNEYNGTYSTVSNCSVSGYTVTFNITSQSQVIAVGGLVGYNFGKIENCSAVSKLVKANTTNSDRNRFVGGIAGSINGKGSIINCYAGGTLETTAQSKGTTYIAGICGGYDGIYGAYNGVSGRAQKIINSYSYCTWTKAKINGTPYAAVNKNDNISVYNCYYLTNTVGEGISLTVNDGSIAKDYVGLSTVSFLGSGTAVKSGKAVAAKSYPWSNELKGRAYPFPAVVREYNLDTNSVSNIYVHYGDWYVEQNPLPSGYLAYYEKYDNGSYYYQYINNGGTISTVGTYDTNNSRSITSAGYGVLVLADENPHTFTANGAAIGLDSKVIENQTIGKGTYNLYGLSAEGKSTLSPTVNDKYKNVAFGYNIVDYNFTSNATVTAYVNINFANNISPYPISASQYYPLEVRTAEQLQNMDTAGAGWYIKQTHNITATAQTGNINNVGYTFDGSYVSGGSGTNAFTSYPVGSYGNYIIGLERPLFISIGSSGIVKNVAIVDADITVNNTSSAALAVTNAGTITNSFTQGKVTSTGNATYAAGFAAVNTGKISSCYSSCNVESQYGSASGFVRTNTNRGVIYDCFSTGEISAESGLGTGFIALNSSTVTNAIQNCYTVSNISAKTGYGFGTSTTAYGINSANCFWAQESGYNEDYTAGGNSATVKSLSQMKSVFTNGVWTTNNSGYSWPVSVSGNYPYPRIFVLDYCGNWSTPASGGKIGVFTIYRHQQQYWYAASGIGIDINKPSELLYYEPENNSYKRQTNRFGIFIDSKFADEFDDWTISYSYYGYYWYSGTITTATSNITMENLYGLTPIEFDIPSYYTLYSITFSNKTDSSKYFTFYYDSYSKTFSLQ